MKKKSKKLKRERINVDTISLNLEEFCRQDPLCPYFKDDWSGVVLDPRRYRKKGSTISR